MKLFSGVSVVLSLTLALPAVATAPVFVVNPITPSVISKGPGGCLFDVALIPQPGRPNKGEIIEFADGSEIFHGATFVTLTNVATSKSINLNISGPGRFSVTDNTFTFLGPALVAGLPPNVLPPNLPSVFVAHGQLVQQFDSSGNIVSVSFTGEAENICDLLQ